MRGRGKKQYRVPIESLSKSKQENIRRKNKAYSKNYRQKDKAAKAAQMANQVEVEAAEIRTQVPTISSTDSTSEPVSSTTRRKSSPLLVKLKFNDKKPKSKKRSNALTRAYSKINSLETKVKRLEKSTNRWKKRCRRQVKTPPEPGTSQISVNVFQDEPPKTAKSTLTPSSRAKKDLRNAGMSPRKMPRSIVKTLTMANAVIDEVKTTRNQNQKQRERKVVTRVIGGDLIKKYKCISLLKRETGVSRKSLRKVNSKLIDTTVRRARLTLLRQSIKEQVRSFMERDDISRVMPGKNHAKMHEG